MATPTLLEYSDDIARLDGQHVLARGIYRARPMPVQGGTPAGRPADRAALELAGGVDVWLEPLDLPQSRRTDDELRRCADRRVQVTGTLHALMPARGQGLMAPCLTDTGTVERVP